MVLPAWRPVGETLAAKAIIVKDLRHVVLKAEVHGDTDRIVKGLNRVVPRVKDPKLVDRKVKGLNRVVPKVKDHDTVRVPPNSNGVVALQAMHEDGVTERVIVLQKCGNAKVTVGQGQVIAGQTVNGVTEKVIVLQKCDNAKVTEGRGQVIADQAVDRGHAPKVMTVMWNVARIETMTK